jgi:hypothetical protein
MKENEEKSFVDLLKAEKEADRIIINSLEKKNLRLQKPNRGWNKSIFQPRVS